MDWTEERNSRLRDLWDEGLSTRAIAAALGVTKNAIVGKSYRLGLERRCPSNRPGSAPRPQPVPAKRPERPGHPVLELRVGVCRWPLGDPRTSAFRFCLDPTEGGTTYCPGHRIMATRSKAVGERRNETRPSAS